jgi:hypothetical protein
MYSSHPTLYARLIRTSALAAIVVSAACQDVPTTSRAVADVPVAVARGLHSGQVPFTCALRLRAKHPGGSPYMSRQNTYYFPRSEINEGGQLVQYSLRQVARDGGVVFIATCMVPYTESALRRLDRHFGISTGGGAEQFVSRQGIISTQGCVSSEEGCVLEPINVTVEQPTDDYDPCDYDPVWCSGWGGSGGYGGDDANGGSGGSGTHPTDVMADTLPNCAQEQQLQTDPTQNWQHAYCNSSPPEGERLTKTRNALERIRQRGGECANIATAGLNLLAAGRLRYYAYHEAYGSVGGWGSPEVGALLDSGWIDGFSDSDPNLQGKLIHEIEHAMGRLEHYTTMGYNQTLNENACSGR